MAHQPFVQNGFTPSASIPGLRSAARFAKGDGVFPDPMRYNLVLLLAGVIKTSPLTFVLF